jgi:hypothetical protein
MTTQPKFELAEKDVQFAHMNTRTEKHGEEDVLAVDLDMMMSCSNEALAMLHPTLRWSLYEKPDVGNSDLADQALADQLIRLRYPKLAALRWDNDMMNCTVTFHYGVQKKDIVLTDAKVNKFKITAHDGGTVELAWRVQANPTHEQIGRLSERLSTGVVSVSIEAGEVVEEMAPVTNTPELNPLDQAAAHEDDEHMHEPGRPARRQRRGTTVGAE